MHGNSKFSFWIPRALAKFCFLHIVSNRAKISLSVLVGITYRKQSVCTVTKVGTVLNAYLEASPSNIVSFGRLKWDATVKALSNKPACVNNATLSCGDSNGPGNRSNTSGISEYASVTDSTGMGMCSRI